MFEPVFFRQQREQSMAERGWGVVIQAPDAGDQMGSHSYTVGLTARGLPELLTTASLGEQVGGLLEELGRRVYDEGRRFTDGERITGLPLGTVIIRDVVAGGLRSPEVAHRLYGADRVRVQQVVLLDGEGNPARYQELLF